MTKICVFAVAVPSNVGGVAGDEKTAQLFDIEIISTDSVDVHIRIGTRETVSKYSQICARQYRFTDYGNT